MSKTSQSNKSEKGKIMNKRFFFFFFFGCPLFLNFRGKKHGYDCVIAKGFYFMNNYYKKIKM